MSCIKNTFGGICKCALTRSNSSVIYKQSLNFLSVGTTFLTNILDPFLTLLLDDDGIFLSNGGINSEKIVLNHSGALECSALFTLKFMVKKSFFLHGHYYLKGDLLVFEKTSPSVIQEAATLAIKGMTWRKSYQTVAFFDINENTSKNYGAQDIEKIFSAF